MMTQNYKELVNVAIDNNDWDSAIKLCQQAKDELAEKTIFGMKKGYINIIRYTNWKTVSILKPGFEELGYKCYNSNDFKNKYDEIIATYPNEILVLFVMDEAIVSKLAKKFLPIVDFKCVRSAHVLCRILKSSDGTITISAFSCSAIPSAISK